MAQFESTYKGKVNLVFINVDEAGTPEKMQYGGVGKSTGIPLTVWVDTTGHELDEYTGILSPEELAKRTEDARNKVRLQGKTPRAPLK